MTICFQYGYRKPIDQSGHVFGIDVANENLLKAWFRYGTEEKFLCRPDDGDSYNHFVKLAQEQGIAEERCVGLDPRTPQHNLGTVSCLFRMDPAIADSTWRRQQVEGRGYASCGIVHTMSGSAVTAAIAELCLAPTDATDALICPSNAVRATVHKMWDIYSEYLAHRFNATFKCPVQTPVIPLGIHTDKFVEATTADKRKAQRAALNIAEDEIVILCLGRLSISTKAHPLPLLLAAEQAQKNTRRKLRLIFYGYFKPEEMEADIRKLAQSVCKTIKYEFVMNNDPRFPDALWAAADIFTSLVENIQESFGLTPIEAMASGLPCVITDWDGYRDGVRDGIDGYLIKTFMPPPSAGQEMAVDYFNLENYGAMLIGSAQSTAIDINQAAQAFVALAEDDNKRREMGLSARQRAQQTYDWRIIIPAYHHLWHTLSAQRRAQKPAPTTPSNWAAAHLAYPNPWKLFESFPTEILSPTDSIRITRDEAEVTEIISHPINLFMPELLMPAEAMQALIAIIRQNGTMRIEDLLVNFPVQQQARVWRCVGWLLKHGICVRESAA